jgi:hypothetical protein
MREKNLRLWSFFKKVFSIFLSVIFIFYIIDETGLNFGFSNAIPFVGEPFHFAFSVVYFSLFFCCLTLCEKTFNTLEAFIIGVFKQKTINAEQKEIGK